MAGWLLFWCTALIVYPIIRVHSGLALWMLWNLFLAAVPLAFGTRFRSLQVRRRPALAGFYFLLWLLFLPNAPYILTDLLHLYDDMHHSVPLWYTLAMLLSCALTGTMLGYLSLIDVHDTIEAQFGKRAGWAVTAGSLMLCGFGIYLGRYLRWNSWDAFNRPISLLKIILQVFIDPGPFPHPLPVTIIFGIGLIVGYIALRTIIYSMHTDL